MTEEIIKRAEALQKEKQAYIEGLLERNKKLTYGAAESTYLLVKLAQIDENISRLSKFLQLHYQPLNHPLK